MTEMLKTIANFDEQAKAEWSELRRKQEEERHRNELMLRQMVMSEQEKSDIKAKEMLRQEQERTAFLALEAQRQAERLEMERAQDRSKEPDYSKPVPEEQVRRAEQDRLVRDMAAAKEEARFKLEQDIEKAIKDFGDERKVAEEREAKIAQLRLAREIELQRELIRINEEARERLERMVAPYQHEHDR